MIDYTHDLEVTPGEVRRAWGAIMDGRNPFTDRQDKSLLVSKNLREYRSPVKQSWIGATGAEINDRLNHGYTVEDADLKVDGGQTEFVMPMMLLDEDEGDLLVDQVLGGEDLYRVSWTDEEAPKSLTIRACIGMAAGTDANVLADYLTWLLKVIDAAQRRGVTPDVELWIGTRGSFQRMTRETMRIRIPLVKSGEMIDVDSWRAYLTPGAFRSLGFVAIALAADKTPRRLTPGMGAPTNDQWSVTSDDGVLNIECPAFANSFPEADMNLALEAAASV